MKSALAASAVAAMMVMGVASTASAATVTNTYALNGSPYDDQDSVRFGNRYSAGTSFTDIYTFALNGSSGTASFSLTNTGRVITNFIGNLYAGIYNGTQTAVATTNLDTTRPQQEDFVSALYPTGDVPIGSGTYSFVVTGTTTGSASTSSVYSGTGFFQVSSVPLPSSVAMFGAAIFGLGAFGAMRKKKASAAA